MKACIYLDESGDLGWNFDHPYRQGGSSRFLTIACVITPSEDVKRPKKVIKRLYDKFNWPTNEEKKWAHMSPQEKIDFSTKAKNLRSTNPQIRYMSMTVRKENVQEHIRADSNKLYNYMISKLLLNEMAKYDEVTFIPDPRTIKVKSGNSLPDYLQTQLWFEKQVTTKLNYQPISSDQSLNLQFADMLSGCIQSHFEDTNSTNFNLLKDCISYKVLFF